ncbi:MAG: ATP-binding protein [Fimbriimonadaceae bacterium]|nr:ATP-binding protein [Fimbriimonadaceae bacterium]
MLAQLHAWLAEPREGEHLEFKEAKAQFDSRELRRYCVALANVGGGHLVLGVSNAVPTRAVPCGISRRCCRH